MLLSLDRHLSHFHSGRFKLARHGSFATSRFCFFQGILYSLKMLSPAGSTSLAQALANFEESIDFFLDRLFIYLRFCRSTHFIAAKGDHFVRGQ